MKTPHITRRELGALAAAAIAAKPKSMPAQVHGSEPALDIADWSYHWYGVEKVTLARGTVCNGMQMYVEHWIPTIVRHPYAVVLIHGGYGQRLGLDQHSRRRKPGWVTLFLQQGYKVYLLDRPGQGRNPYQPFVHGAFAAQAPTFEAAARDAGIASISDTRAARKHSRR